MDKNLKESIDRLGREYVKELTRQLISLDKDATGNLISSLDWDVVQTANGVILTIVSADYLKYVDSGRKPGKMVPVKPLITWAKAKNLKLGTKFKTWEQLGWSISKSIAKNGIKPTNVLDKTRDSILNNRERIDDLLTSAGKDLDYIIEDAMRSIMK